jgi:hypothetical protein
VRYLKREVLTIVGVELALSQSVCETELMRKIVFRIIWQWGMDD